MTVRFDEEKLSYERLLGHAKKHGCTTKVWAATDAHLAAARKVVGDRATMLGRTSIRTAKESDQVYYLRNTPLRFLPITPLQARRVNGALYLRQDIKPWLSPRQLDLLSKVQAVLAKRPKALKGLERPTDLAKLDEYEVELRSRLAE